METIKLKLTQERPPFQAGDVITADADFILNDLFERTADDESLTCKVHLLGRTALIDLLDVPSTVVKGTWAHFASNAERQGLIDYLAQ